MENRPSITVVLPVLNVEKHLRRCLESVAWADEILILDGGSTDGTCQIGASFGARIVPQPLEMIDEHLGNFDIVRNVGFELVRGDWILSLDADEVVPGELRDEIRDTIQRTPPRPFLIPRENLYWGRPVRLLGEDYQLRLFPKGSVRYEGVDLDARPISQEQPGCLKSRLRHYSVEDLTLFFKKLNDRTNRRARVRLARKMPIYPWQPLTAFARTFWRYYIDGAAWKDGARGLLVPLLYALDPCITLLKHYLLRFRALAWPGRAERTH